ncbi:serine hydrolase domain-containing protein [Rubinisphaera margarita]|uniref:serine hydrolase domain-containing protein n=1 Tax=Rubinisphaera margarita TaxID=2909586 RepID=UPI001EE86E45|nr:serine hydrolase domain-containing protein [Rubinisphaera margarita]MCG6157811.1 beta-lactamase family protein [Rubinisphaera margarita]
MNRTVPAVMIIAVFLTAVSLAEEQFPGIPARFQPAVDYLEARDGHAFLVYRDGKLVAEIYLNGWSADKPHRLASGTKSFSAAMAIVGIQDGLLEFDDKVSDTITEWKSDPRSEITVRQLLSLTSGIDPGPTGRVPSYASAVEAELRNRPGRRFAYGPVPFQIFGEFMRRKLEPQALSPEEYLKQKVLDPIGMKVDAWRTDVEGNPHLPSGMSLKAREWAKYGQLICNLGKHEGRQILDEALLRECFQPSEAQSRYGITFWLNNTGKGPADLVMAAGAGKQKLYIVPSLKVVIVQFAEAESKRYAEVEFLKLALPPAILP